MNLEKRVNAFAELGKFLNQFSQEKIEKQDNIKHNDLFFDGFKHQLKLAQEHNGWFTNENVLFAIEGWSNQLNYNNINKWLKKYNFNTIGSKKVAIIMAGNIPLVGFHDFLSVLISGHQVLVKQSSNDKHLLPFLAKYLEHIEPGFKNKIIFTEEKLEGFDAVIATGSDNTARYFEYYWLGCRNVSKLFVPKEYDFKGFFEAVYKWHPIINQAKYANNYDYNKAVYLMSEFEMLENGFLMIKEDLSYASPIATLFYEYYDSKELLNEKLKIDKDKIQCIVASGFVDSEITFGETQRPELWNYADDIDTIEFLLKI